MTILTPRIQVSISRQFKRELCAKISESVATRLRKRNLTQAAVANELGMSSPRLCSLLGERLHLFSLEYLVDVAHRLGLRVQLKVVRGYAKPPN